jgi:ribose transport system permease protein
MKRRPSFGRVLPYVTLAIAVVAVVIATALDGKTITLATGYVMLEYAATIGPLALGLGVALIAGQFDTSVGAMFGFGGIVAVMAGASSWELGLATALAVGALVGIVYGTLVLVARLDSLTITLGGLITLSGLAYVLSDSKTVTFSDYSIGIRLTEPVLEVFSIHSFVVLACFLVVGLVLAYTRAGRNVYAVGGSRAAAERVGLPVRKVVVGVLVLSAVLAALSGSLIGFTLASASPENTSNPLFPAIIAALIGGVRLTGGVGTVLGIFAGLLTVAVVNTGLNLLSAPTYASSLAYGALLLAAAVSAAPDLRSAVKTARRRMADRLPAGRAEAG